MTTLKEEHQLFIVQALAAFDSPTQVADAVREEFGVELTRQQVQRYDPTKVAGQHLSKKLRALFEQTRKTYLEETAQIPIAKQTYRLRTLQRLLDKAGRNLPLAAALLEQAAKEAGGMFTNRRELSGPAGGPIPMNHSGKVEHLHTMGDAELERIAAGLPPVASADSGGS